MKNGSLDQTALRLKLIQQRKSVCIHEQKKISTLVSSHFLKSSLFSDNHYIASYYPFICEIETRKIIEAIWHYKKRCYLPVLDSEKRLLLFKEYKADSKTLKNRYGIIEPIETESRDTVQLDLVLVPLVGFDKKGHRIGMGAGYYDRTFSFLKDSISKSKPFLCGLAYSCQEVESISPNPWDIPLNAVITENEIIKF